MSRTFIDTNVWLYTIDPRDQRKRDVAQRRIAELSAARLAVVSPQVIAEFARAALEKMRASPDDVKRSIDQFDIAELAPFSAAAARRAVELRQLYQIAFWDAMIVASAERVGCGVLLSEDFNAGQAYSGVVVENPFG